MLHVTARYANSFNSFLKKLLRDVHHIKRQGIQHKQPKMAPKRHETVQKIEREIDIIYIIISSSVVLRLGEAHVTAKKLRVAVDFPAAAAQPPPPMRKVPDKAKKVLLGGNPAFLTFFLTLIPTLCLTYPRKSLIFMLCYSIAPPKFADPLYPRKMYPTRC